MKNPALVVKLTNGCGGCIGIRSTPRAVKRRSESVECVEHAPKQELSNVKKSIDTVNFEGLISKAK